MPWRSKSILFWLSLVSPIRSEIDLLEAGVLRLVAARFSIGESLPDGRDGRLGTPAAAGGTEPDWRRRRPPEMRSRNFDDGMSQQFPDFLKPCLNLFPRRMRAITEQRALRL